MARSSSKKTFNKNYADVANKSAPGGITTEKMPLAINGGKTTIYEYMNIPVDQLIPFRNKQGSDFSRKDSEFFQGLVDSIRESGIIDALSIRPIGPDQYEILAGETRWLAAQEAGLAVVPCHVMKNIDDNRARRIFAITNLFRRTLLPSDRINGWWHYYQAMKEEGRLKELREGLSDPEVLRITGSDTGIQYRQIMHYVKMHTLIPEWLDRLDNDKLAVRIARKIALLDVEKQKQLLPYRVTEEDAQLLSEIATGKNTDFTWSEEFLSKTLTHLNPLPQTTESLPSEELSTEGKPEAAVSDTLVEQPWPAVESALLPHSLPSSDITSEHTDKQLETQTDDIDDQKPEQYQQEKLLRKAKPHIMKAIKVGLRPNDYKDAESIILKALVLYYKMLDMGTLQEDGVTIT